MTIKSVKSTKNRGRGKRVDPAIVKKEIVETILEVQPKEQVTQAKLMESIGRTQMTVIRYVSELKGEGVICEDRFGTSTIYSITSLDALIEKGYMREVINEEMPPFLVKVGKYDDRFAVQFGIPPIIKMVIPIDGNDLLEALNSLEETIVTVTKKLKKARKRIEAELKGGE